VELWKLRQLNLHRQWRRTNNDKNQTNYVFCGNSLGDIDLRIVANGEIVEIKFKKHGACCPQLCQVIL
jgi:hypothetical protein